MTVAVAAGFALTTVLGVCIFVCLAALYRDTDNQRERLTNVENLVAGWLPEHVTELEQVGGWPETEPNPIHPPTVPTELRGRHRTRKQAT